MTDKPVYSLDFCQEYAVTRSGKCLSKSYIDRYQPLIWECYNDHIWEQALHYILKGNWCKKCKNIEKRKQLLKKYQEFAEKYGGKCLSDDYINEQVPLLWQCSIGHMWYSIPHTIINQKFSCMKCDVTEHKNKLLNQCKEYAKTKDGECLSTEFKNIRTIMQWRCSAGHTFDRSYMFVEKGSWCHVCEKDDELVKDDITLAECQDLAYITHGGVCLAYKYKRAYHKLLWQCRNDHRWHDTAFNVCRKRKWCPTCQINNM